MKKKLSQILLYGFITCLCCACAGNEPEKSSNEIISELEKYSEYTYANYTIGAKVYFVKETGEAGYYTITENGIYTIKTHGQPDEHFISINMIKEYDDDNKGICLGASYQDGIKWMFGTEKKPVDATDKATSPFDLEEDEMYLENTAGQWMVLKKGIGIYKTGDQDGHTWVSMKASRP